MSSTSLLVDPEDHLIHRDLSWWQFNDRVMSEAEDASNPLLERLKFLAIAASNSDEFFMIRFAALDKELQKLSRAGEEQQTKFERLKKIRQKILETAQTFNGRYNNALTGISEGLAAHQIRICRDLTGDLELNQIAGQVYENVILPLLIEATPADPQHLREIQNLQIAVIYPDGTLLRIPRETPPMIWTRNAGGYAAFFTDDLLFHFCARRFGENCKPLIFRIARDADVSLEIGSEDHQSIPNLVRKTIHSRETGKPVRIQYRSTSDKTPLESVMQALKLDADQTFAAKQPLTLRGIFALLQELSGVQEVSRDLFYPKLHQMVPDVLQPDAPILDNLHNRDYLLHHPYDSFEAYANFIAAAVADPEVESIQQTIYRVDALSPVIELLKTGAKTKQVRVVIEPRARFDETNNIKLAEELNQAGVQVVFHTGKLKLHAKLTLVSRKVNGELRQYTHLSTGNYNAKTAREYTDMAIITADPAIGADAARFFDAVCGGLLPEGMKQLVLAPTGLHKKIMQLIRAEASAAREGKPARIFAKVNALVDEVIIQELYEASKAGVKIDLIVRGACSLLPGMQGVSENIRVLSIVDRFLEHSRIYFFHNANQIYLSSADWMPRNFFSRLEVAFPILDSRLFEFITQYVIPYYLGDRVKARLLTKNGSWRSLRQHAKDQPEAPQEALVQEGATETRAQGRFEALARNNYVGTPLVF